jgi:hypothetical protein
MRVEFRISTAARARHLHLIQAPARGFGTADLNLLSMTLANMRIGRKLSVGFACVQRRLDHCLIDANAAARLITLTDLAARLTLAEEAGTAPGAALVGGFELF